MEHLRPFTQRAHSIGIAAVLEEPLDVLREAAKGSTVKRSAVLESGSRQHDSRSEIRMAKE